MDSAAVLAAFDAQIRQGSHGPGAVVERADGVVRVVAGDDDWAGVTWSDLDEVTADTAIAAQIQRFAHRPGGWEWKHYSYDRPLDLAERLKAAGFVPEPTEALMVAELSELSGLEISGAAPSTTAPAGVEIVPVTDLAGVQSLVSVHDAVFGGDHSGLGRALAAVLGRDGEPGGAGELGRAPVTVAAFLAVADGLTIAAGRVELAHGTDFASLWGGGTLEAWRGRGVFRALVAHRAALAAAAGFRYLQVDASADSQPILRRLGFIELAKTTPFGLAGPVGRVVLPGL